jgi:hypothetical protein
VSAVFSCRQGKGKGEAASWDEENLPPYICPVTLVEMTAKQPFVVIRTTGWVLSDRAIREIGGANLQVRTMIIIIIIIIILVMIMHPRWWR